MCLNAVKIHFDRKLSVSTSADVQSRWVQRQSRDSRGSPLTTRQTLRGELAASCTPTRSHLLSTAFHP